jgi:hypothetical protein
MNMRMHHDWADERTYAMVLLKHEEQVEYDRNVEGQM